MIMLTIKNNKNCSARYAAAAAAAATGGFCCCCLVLLCLAVHAQL